MELIPPNTKFDFMSKRGFFIPFSILVNIFALYIWFSKGDAKYGVDYKGGAEIVVRVDDSAVGSEGLRELFNKNGVPHVVVQAFEASSKQFSIKWGEANEDTKQIKEKVSQIFDSAYTGKYEVVRLDYVGPTIGKELRTKAIIATLFGIVVILLYLAFRFEFAYGLGAVVALIHDVLVCLAAYLLSGRDINASTLAAAMTIVGYSVNDTIVIFDMVREELRKGTQMPFIDLLNHCLNKTLSRTFITSGLTLLSCIALLIYGGGAISDLSFFLVVGIITGTYSSIYIAAPIVLYWERFRQRAA